MPVYRNSCWKMESCTYNFLQKCTQCLILVMFYQLSSGNKGRVLHMLRATVVEQLKCVYRLSPSDFLNQSLP